MDRLVIQQQSLGKRRTTAIHLDIDTYLKIEKASILTGRSKTEIVAEMVDFALKYTEINHSDIKCDFGINTRDCTPSISEPDSTAPSKPYVPVKEAVEITGLSEYYFRKHLETGEIPAIRVGKKWMINIETLLEKLQVMTQGGNE